MADRMVFIKTGLIGGLATDLDSIDGANRGDTNPLQDGDVAVVLDSGTFYAFILDVDSALPESSPDVIRPDTNYGDKRWILQGTVASIADGSLALAKLADMATASVYYRKTAGAGAPEVNTLATLKTDLGLAGINTGDEPDASITVAGIVELCVNTEVDAGTDDTRAITPDALAGSIFGKKVFKYRIVEKATDVVVTDYEYFDVPDEFNGMNLIRAVSIVDTAGTTGSTTMGVLNVTDSQEMLSTLAAIETGETSTRTSETPGVIDTDHDDVATGDRLKIYLGAVSGTAPKGWTAELAFALP